MEKITITILMLLLVVSGCDFETSWEDFKKCSPNQRDSKCAQDLWKKEVTIINDTVQLKEKCEKVSKEECMILAHS